ncbi:MAG: tRNA-uridine aminocarboxypropyltransferase [Pseudohongiellaceae bacterium]
MFPYPLIMTGRAVCNVCNYPQVVCLCGALIQAEFETELVILQHPSETLQAKNTARLISLVASDVEIIVGETAQDFSALQAQLKGRGPAVVIFPSTESVPLASLPEKDKVKTVILLDGTWRKAKKIWHCNPWLRSLSVCNLETQGVSSYRIRRSRETGGVSTLEAAALALETIEGANTEPLYSALEAMQSHWPNVNES